MNVNILQDDVNDTGGASMMKRTEFLLKVHEKHASHGNNLFLF